MNKPKITQTTHTLPFNNLESFQFERLCYWLLDLGEKYTDLEYMGSTGDKQRDIIGIDKNNSKWYIQCKNYSKATAKVFKIELEKISKNINEESSFSPYGIIFIVGCRISSRTKDATIRFAKELGLKFVIQFWDIIKLDNLVKSNPDILNEFFGIKSEDFNYNHIEEKEAKQKEIRQKKFLKTIIPLPNMDVFHIDPWSYAETKEEYALKKSLRELLIKSGKYQKELEIADFFSRIELRKSIIKLWEPLLSNPYFKIDHPYWTDKPYFRYHLQLAWGYLLGAYLNLSINENIRIYLPKALDALYQFVYGKPYSLEGASKESLAYDDAKSANFNYYEGLKSIENNFLKLIQIDSGRITNNEFFEENDISIEKVNDIIILFNMRLKDLEIMIE